MATHLDPAEVQAILDLDRADRASVPAEVTPRDFARPMRLRPGELEAVRTRLRAAVPRLEETLGRSLRKSHRLELAEAAEVSSEGLFADVEGPLAILAFEVVGQPGWLAWDPAAAVAAVEVALGAMESGAAQARELSPVERQVLVRLLSPLASELGRALGLEPTAFSAPAIRDEIRTWRDGGRQADRRRLHVHLAFDGPGGPSALRLWLPGVEPAAEAEPRAEPTTLPRHLEGVRVSVAARLGSSEIPLSELLGIEPGDVIPLSTPANAPLDIYLEDVPCARAVLGSRHGSLAVQIVEVGPREEEQ